MSIDVIDAHFNGQLAIGNKDDALLAVQGAGKYSLVIFAAKEVQPPPQALLDKISNRGLRMIYMPLLDDQHNPLTQQERFALQVYIPAIAQAYRNGGRILCTCNLGVNRSALVAALVLDEVHRFGGAEALRAVRTRRVRGRPLSNPYYATLLEQRPARGAPTQRIVL